MSPKTIAIEFNTLVYSGIYCIVLILASALAFTPLSLGGAILAAFVFLFYLKEHIFAYSIGVWAIWYASIQLLDAVVDDYYFVCSFVLIPPSLWLAVGPEIKKYKKVRSGFAISLALLNCSVGLVIKDKRDLTTTITSTVIYCITSVALNLIDECRRTTLRVPYHVLATVWILTLTSGTPIPLSIGAMVVKVVFCMSTVIQFAQSYAEYQQSLAVVTEKKEPLKKTKKHYESEHSVMSESETESDSGYESSASRRSIARTRKLLQTKPTYQPQPQRMMTYQRFPGKPPLSNDLRLKSLQKQFTHSIMNILKQDHDPLDGADPEQVMEYRKKIQSDLNS